MNVWELLLGAAAGVVGGIIAKDKLIPNNDLVKAKSELENLYNENNKYRDRNKDLERTIEDLQSQLNKVRHQNKNDEFDRDDLEEALSQNKRTIKRLQDENHLMKSQIEEYKKACDAYNQQIEELKNKH